MSSSFIPPQQTESDSKNGGVEVEISRYIDKVKRDYREYIEEEEIEQECYVIYYEKKGAGYSDNAVYKAIKVRMEQMKEENMRTCYATPILFNLGIVGINDFLNAEKTPSYSLGA